MSELEQQIENSHQKQQVFTLSKSSTPSSSISLIKLDELSSFGATKQSRLPTLIKLNSIENNKEQETRQTSSMPAYNSAQSEQEQAKTQGKEQTSLPSQMKLSSNIGGKENKAVEVITGTAGVDLSEDFHMVDVASVDLIGPSLPAPRSAKFPEADFDCSALTTASQFVSQHQQQQQQSGFVGDSLIDMIISLRSENQNLVRALETNNEFVKERLADFKRISEESKQREAKFATEKADYEHQIRKLKRQNTVLSDRLKSLEAKLKEMKGEVDDTLDAAHSSKASSVRATEEQQMYPNLTNDSFDNSAIHQAVTMQVDAPSTSGQQEASGSGLEAAQSAEPNLAEKVGNMTTEELSKRFDARKAEFYALDDPMEQCDKLEQQLNDIGKRDYEICLLQQQLNIYRQDFRLERMANLEAKIQIEKLKNDIDRLCLERLNEKSRILGGNEPEEAKNHLHRSSHHRRSSGGVRFENLGAGAEAVFSKLGHQLSKKAAKSAAKAAKYASKQAHREEKAAAAKAASQVNEVEADEDNRGHRRQHSQHHRHHRGIKSEVVNDLLSTANKAMLTGYKMASTHVNMALDRLSQPASTEQVQQGNSNQQATGKPVASAPPMSLPLD